MKFYDCTTAPSPRRVRIFLAEKGISVPTVQVDLRNNEQLKPEFRAINPDATVPVLELDNGTRITDATASASISRRPTRSRGARYSLADITALVSVDFARWVKLSVPEECKNLRRWHVQVSARPSANA
jgi:glutathione S-transferase